MLKLSGKRLFETGEEKIEKQIRILYVPNDKDYVLVCNGDSYRLKKENNYLVWDVPKNNKAKVLSIKVQAVNKVGKTQYITNEIDLLTEQSEPVMSRTMTIDSPSFDSDYPAVAMVDDHAAISVVNRKISMPANYVVVVANDSVSQLLTFEVSRYYDGVDLSEKACNIKFINAKGERGRAIPVNVSRDSQKLRLGWLLDSNVSARAGKVTFQVEFLGQTDDGSVYAWQSLKSELMVEDGILVDDAIVEERYPTLVEDILIRLKMLEGKVESNSENEDDFALIYYDSELEFPNVGNTKTMYIVKTFGEEAIYRWSETDLKYYVIGNNYNNIKVITGGSAVGS